MKSEDEGDDGDDDLLPLSHLSGKRSRKNAGDEVNDDEDQDRTDERVGELCLCRSESATLSA